MTSDKEKFLDEFADLFIREWAHECGKRGIKYIDHPGSTSRMLARVIGRTLHEWDKRTAEIVRTA